MKATLRAIAIVLGPAVLLTLLFWGPLWSGAGFIGGDLYPYFFPQKTFLADRLHAGEFPLWNNLTGFGYPVLGESQTGAAYPLYLLGYYLFDVNTAYNVEHLLHYILCFVGTWLFGKRIGLTISGSVLTAIVFTYGWFPPRACLEWAIVTGSWLPVAMWCVESLIQTRWWRYAIGLSLVLGLQLLAGHFHLAFITQLLVMAYGLWRVRSVTRSSANAGNPLTLPVDKIPLVVALLAAMTAGFLLAAVQLVPAWELKTRSSRATVGGDHEPSYGHLPPLYVSQMFAPWIWYSPAEIRGDDTIRTVAEFGAPWHWFGPHRNLDEAVMQSRAGGLTTIATNKVEAHLYCGLVPLGLAGWWLIAGIRARSRTPHGGQRFQSGSAAPSRTLARGAPQSVNVDVPVPPAVPVRGEACFWVLAGIVAVIYATGWLLPVARFIPGFNFFRGPGRYGIVTTLAVAVLAGRGLDEILVRRAGFARFALLCCFLWSAVGDLWLVSRMVTYATMVPRPAIALRDQSPIRKLLLARPTLPRLYAPMQNLGNLLGVSCLPVYLGIAPAEYSDGKFAGQGRPKADGRRAIPADEEFSRWLRESGVTHILSEHPLEESSWRATPVWQGVDPLINSAMGRPEPLFLYELTDAPGRVSLTPPDRESVASGAIAPQQREANQFVVTTTASTDATLLARDLNYPGWQPDIDGRPVKNTSAGVFREVLVPAGEHRVTWSYRPNSVKLGLAISISTLLALAAIGHVRFWHQQWLNVRIARLLSRPRRNT